MNRKYSIEECDEIIAEFKREIPNSSLSTDIIVGYPGETREEFEETINYLKKVCFDMVNVSKYSARPKTVAKTLKQVPKEEIKKRSLICSQIVMEISEEKNKDLIGKEMIVLATELAKNGILCRSESYKPFIAKYDDIKKFNLKRGSTFTTKIEDAGRGFLTGKIINSNGEFKNEDYQNS